MLLDQLSTNSSPIALDDLSQTRSWSELYRNARCLASYISSQGVTAGSHIALLMRNRVEYIEVVIASLFTGVWLTPVNWHLAGDEIDYILRDCGAELVFTERYFSSILANTPSAVAIEDINFDQLALYSIDLQQSPGAIMMYTSGTTGKPKGVKRAKPATLQAALDQQSSAGTDIGLNGSGAHLVTGPLYHAAPMLYALYDLANGAPLVIMPVFDASKALLLIQHRQIHHSHWVPTMFVRALRCRDQFPSGLISLSLVLHGAAPIAIDVKKQMIDWWGPVLVEYWGGTESGVVSRADSQQWQNNPGTVGKALPQFEIMTVDDSGQTLAAGDRGLLCIRHKQLVRPFEYHNDSDKTDNSYIRSGLFSLGDIGYVNADGFVFLLDRQSHMIISGGVNIYPAEIEAVLQLHPAVSDVAVLGVPNAEWGEEVKAVIELTDKNYCHNTLDHELRLLAEQKLAGFKCPRSFDIVEQLPRYETGKLFIRRLRDHYWQGQEHKI